LNVVWHRKVKDQTKLFLIQPANISQPNLKSSSFIVERVPGPLTDLGTRDSVLFKRRKKFAPKGASILFKEASISIKASAILFKETSISK